MVCANRESPNRATERVCVCVCVCVCVHACVYFSVWGWVVRDREKKLVLFGAHMRTEVKYRARVGEWKAKRSRTVSRSLLTFLQAMNERLPQPTQRETILPVHVAGISITSPMIQSMCLDVLARILVSCRWIQWCSFMLCSTTADLSG
jgi:hypothetical protein